MSRRHHATGWYENVFLESARHTRRAQFSNPLQFDPDRWLHDGSRPRTTHDSRAYLQFGAGPRVCPGRYLAAVEMRPVLSMLMANFSIRMAVNPSTIREMNAFTMVLSAMPVHLSARTT
ncbi:cytochrome P450 [Paraburkholderia sp. RL17-373-BIF-A]|uniref:cytochrome P450 n=1 Tax=Paraburkholderia sp. RL17-373-BIF-A TaxID=3031629 RepID=UPI0038B8CE3D